MPKYIRKGKERSPYLVVQRKLKTVERRLGGGAGGSDISSLPGSSVCQSNAQTNLASIYFPSVSPSTLSPLQQHVQ